MSIEESWSRRRFVAVSGATAMQVATGLPALPQATSPSTAQRDRRAAASVMPPPEVITGGVRPLFKGQTARPLRYRPVDGDFVIRNGGEFFNRPIYGVSSPTQSGDFRVDAGDLPEFSLYLPGHGGNLKLGFIAADGSSSKWAAQADEVIARYRPGRMIYEIRDTMLAAGTLHVELLTLGEGQGALLKVEAADMPAHARLAWAFGGVSGRKGRRNGDIGCEVEPVSQFFQLRPEECDGNHYTLDLEGSDESGTAVWSGARLTSKAARLLWMFPYGSVLQVGDFAKWNRPPVSATPGSTAVAQPPSRPILTGSIELSSAPLFLAVEVGDERIDALLHGFATSHARSFALRSAQVTAIAATIKIESSDAYLNAAAPALGIAAETIWDARQQCVLHGGVAWRVALAGWRGPYSLDALGNHDRARQHFRHWLDRQNVSAIEPTERLDGEVVGPWDAGFHRTRKEGMLHSNGDLSNNHYDMNLVFFDALLRHLMWTGDVAFAREVWPAIERHLAWERRLFRRTFTIPGGRELPLYEAYAAIWASDNLQYDGGGAAHSSAYNCFAMRAAAQIATLLGEDASAYENEAESIHRAMQQLLWVAERGLFAESKGLLAPQTVYTNPALWTVYHTIDSRVPTARQAWQMGAERLATLKRVPVDGRGVPEGGFLLSCSDWLPYVWSLNLLVMAEDVHMALALWQAGMPDEAYSLFKGNLLDSMYMGLCPGDLHMTSALDAHRQEAQRDFGDPIGITSRALVEGLFGIQPDLIAGRIDIRPGFPTGWDHASLHHKDFDLQWRREGLRESYDFTGRLGRAVSIHLALPARTTSLPVVSSGDTRIQARFDDEAVGAPLLRVELPAAEAFRLTLEWHGSVPRPTPPTQTVRVGDLLVLPIQASPSRLDDPQGCLSRGRITAAGVHTVFLPMREGECRWSMPISFTAQPIAAQFAAVPTVPPQAHTEPLDLSGVLNGQVATIFRRGYDAPRSPFCSLGMADTLLGGWANPDGSATIDDTGLRSAGGTLHTPLGVDFATPSGTAPNCRFLSFWKQDQPVLEVSLTGRASGIYLLLAGTTTPQCSRLAHATVSVTYTDATRDTLVLSNPENWWPIEQDYLLDDYLFPNEAPLPPRVELRTGRTRVLDAASLAGNGRTVPGGSATILHLPLDASRQLASLQFEVHLYGIVLALLAASLVRAE